MAISYSVLYNNNMSAGLFAPQDILIFELWLTKAYTKLHCVSIGFFLAQIYIKMNIRKQRMDVKKYNVIYATLQFLISMGIIAFLSLWTLSANKDPPSWSRMKSALFITLSRPAFLLCLVCLFNLLFLGHGSSI